MLTMGSIFAGVGGLDLGFHRAGFDTKWQIEWDKNAQCVLRRHFPNAALHGDVKTVQASVLAPVDVITYGFPCTDVIVAGKRKGMVKGETRSGLFYEAIRLISGVRPRFCVFENVPGLLNSNHGRDFGNVLFHLASIGYGKTLWIILDSQRFGVAQRRRRVFGISAREVTGDIGIQCSEQIQAISEGLRRYIAEGEAEGQDVAGGVGDGFDGCGELAKSVRTPTGGIEREDMHTLIPEIAGCLQERDAKGIDSDTKPGHLIAYDVAHYTRGMAGSPSETASTVVSNSKSGDQENVVLRNMVVRRLTPTECERLQAFPDNWTAWGIDANGKRVEMSDSARHKQMGNAVTVNVGEFIGRIIKGLCNG
jgi:DNA (cytosine-5)-methyltransferase 1